MFVTIPVARARLSPELPGESLVEYMARRSPYHQLEHNESSDEEEDDTDESV